MGSLIAVIKGTVQNARMPDERSSRRDLAIVFGIAAIAAVAYLIASYA